MAICRCNQRAKNEKEHVVVGRAAGILTTVGRAAGDAPTETARALPRSATLRARPHRHHKSALAKSNFVIKIERVAPLLTRTSLISRYRSPPSSPAPFFSHLPPPRGPLGCGSVSYRFWVPFPQMYLTSSLSFQENTYLDILHVFYTYPKRVQDTFWDTHQIHRDTCILDASLVSHWIHVRIHD
jgi:hypothetical protein